MIKKQIPNVFTLLNLLCGVCAIIANYTVYGYVMPAMFIILGACFDFFDGMVARALNVSSPIGKELDSLSDVVTFGVAPALVISSFLHYMLTGSTQISMEDLKAGTVIIIMIPLFMALMSSYRLAKFNLDSRQKHSFIGLPTPANAMFWIFIPIIYNHYGGIGTHFLPSIITPTSIVIMSLVMSVLLVSNLHFFSLKFKNYSWEDNKEKYIFLAICLVLLVVFRYFAFPLIILVYIIESLTINIYTKWNSKRK